MDIIETIKNYFNNNINNDKYYLIIIYYNLTITKDFIDFLYKNNCIKAYIHQTSNLYGGNIYNYDYKILPIKYFIDYKINYIMPCYFIAENYILIRVAYSHKLVKYNLIKKFIKDIYDINKIQYRKGQFAIIDMNYYTNTLIEKKFIRTLLKFICCKVSFIYIDSTGTNNIKKFIKNFYGFNNFFYISIMKPNKKIIRDRDDIANSISLYLYAGKTKKIILYNKLLYNFILFLL